MSGAAAPLAALAVVGVAMAACLAPLLARERVEDDGDAAALRLAEERDRLVAAIKEADLDLAMGKITAADHAEMRRSLEGRAVVVLEELGRAGKEEPGRAPA